MVIIDFLLKLMGATMLLLFAVRMVRTGIERSFGASFKRLLTTSSNRLAASATGLVLAVVLQSSAAVALLVSGFMAAGILGFPMGLAIVLGGDLGSALIIQVLSFQLEWLTPLLLTVGGWLFVKTDHKQWRQAGRVLMGVAFILISLQFLREAMAPIRDSAFLPAISDYLTRDFVTAFIVGGVLAFVMHSSVAAILMCITLVQIGAIPLEVGVSLLLGANLGSALIPIWLSRGMPALARRVPFANLVLRGSWAICALFIINAAGLPAVLTRMEPGQALILLHVLFNCSLLLTLPFCRILEGPFKALLKEENDGDAGGALAAASSALDYDTIDNPAQAIGSLKRELLRMTEQIERMMQPILQMFEKQDEDALEAVCKLDQDVNTMLEEIRRFVAAVPIKNMNKQQKKVIRGLMDYAIRLEAAGDVISKELSRRILQKHQKNVRFSKEGWKELVQMHEAITANLRLASNVLISDDLESARLLVVEKTELKRVERDSRKRHLRRLQDGNQSSHDTSNIHLATLRALRDLNGHISAIAYPILYRNGQLLESRLILEMSEEDTQTA